jgi:hypothetical protein
VKVVSGGRSGNSLKELNQKTCKFTLTGFAYKNKKYAKFVLLINKILILIHILY